MPPKECPICGFNLKETPTKFICNLCGKIIKKHQEPMERKIPLPIKKLKEELGE